MTNAPEGDSPGVYLLFYRKKLVYVGRSKVPADRVKSHRRNGRRFDYAVHFPCPAGDVDWIEMALIEALNPPQNTAGVGTKRDEAPDEIVRLIVKEVHAPPPRIDPNTVMPMHRAHQIANEYGLRRDCMAAIRSGELPSFPSNPANTGPGSKRYVTRGDLDDWIVKTRAVRAKTGWREYTPA